MPMVTGFLITVEFDLRSASVRAILTSTGCHAPSRARCLRVLKVLIYEAFGIFFDPNFLTLA